MALMLGHSIADNSALDLTDIVRRYLAWYRTDAFDTGPVWSLVFKHIAAGVDPADAARLVDQQLGGMTAGANAAHRATAIGCASVIPDALVAAEARREAQLTHWHADAAEASAATALIIRTMLRGTSLSDSVKHAAAATTGVVSAMLQQTILDEQSLSNGGYAPNTLQAALYFTRTSSSFEGAVLSSIAFAGPCNYCPVLVGAFSALKFGVQPVPGCPVDDAIVRDASDTFRRLWNA